MTLTETQVKRLSRLTNYRTRYEVVLSNGLTTYLVLYTSQHSQMGIARAIHQRRDHILSITAGEFPFIAKIGDRFHGNEWRAYFSGRTQREAIMTGELTFASSVEMVEVN